MRKYFLSASLIAALFFSAACQKAFLSSESGDCQVTLTVNVPSPAQTKAISEADYADVVYYEVWNSDWTKQLYPLQGQGLAEAQVVTADVYGETVKQAHIDLTLVKGQTYQFIFWAQNKAFTGYDVTDLKAVKIDYSKFKGNQDSYDAFYNTADFLVSASMEETVYLRRPFAQLNFGASEMSTDLGNIVLTESEVTVSSLATTFDTVDGKGTDMTANPVSFKASTTDNNVKIAEELEIKTNGTTTTYEWIAMNYILMQDQEQTVTVTSSFTVDGLDSPVTHSIPSVPLKMNYRTNIVGDLFTAGARLTVIVVPDFNKDDEIVDIDKL